MPLNATTELSPRAREIVDAARELLEREGGQALSMRALAEQLGIRAPSIYKHFAGKEALEAALISDAFEAQAAVFEAAIEGSDEPLAAIARAYRTFARSHPHLYRLMTERIDRSLIAPGAEERARDPAVRAAGGDPDLARAAWAFAHGMTILELDERFPAGADLDGAWRCGITALQAAAPRATPPRSRRRRPARPQAAR
jgi:AcrR family transcriptional regulator